MVFDQHGSCVCLILLCYKFRLGIRPPNKDMRSHMPNRAEEERDWPEEVFMAMELQPGYLHGARGIIKYHSAFSGL